MLSGDAVQQIPAAAAMHDTHQSGAITDDEKLVMMECSSGCGDAAAADDALLHPSS